MTELKALLEDVGFSNVRTYIQSGNVLFEYEETHPENLERLIESKILERYGFSVHVIIRTPAELEDMLQNNPFLNNRNEDTKRLYVTILSQAPDPLHIEKLRLIDYSPEEYVIDGATIYFFSPHNYGNAKMSNNFFEAKLKVAATTRNWATLAKLVQLANDV